MIRRILIAAALSTLLAATASAQGGGGGRGGGGGGGASFGRAPQVPKDEMLAKEFKLTPEQVTAIDAIMDEAQATPLLAQTTEQRSALLKYSVAGADTSEVTKRLAELNAESLAIEVDAFTKTLAKLDDKQKKNAPKLFDMMAGMFGAPGGWRRSR